MIQLLPLRIIYLIFTTLLMFYEVFPENLSFMRVLKVRIGRIRKVRITLFSVGIALGILTIFLPLQPGPVILGDLLPAIALVLSAFHYTGKVTDEDASPIIDAYWEYGSFRYGVMNSVVIVLDLLFPAFILL